jgi:Na+(H+)/acetate symporter ActP
MDTSTAGWLVIAIALAAANLPFFNDRLFAVIGAKWQRKPLYIRLLEMTALYMVVGFIGFALEANIGVRFPQTWEFYAISGCLFVVLGFPGLIVRYLRKPHG